MDHVCLEVFCVFHFRSAEFLFIHFRCLGATHFHFGTLKAFRKNFPATPSKSIKNISDWHIIGFGMLRRLEKFAFHRAEAWNADLLLLLFGRTIYRIQHVIPCQIKWNEIKLIKSIRSLFPWQCLPMALPITWHRQK